jgi:hypothetical protein
MQKLRFKLRIEDLTTSDEAVARLLAAGSARREIGGAGGTPRRDWHRQNFACPRDPHDYGQANQNQRRTTKLLGISRSTLARHLRGVAQE